MKEKNIALIGNVNRPADLNIRTDVVLVVKYRILDAFCKAQCAQLSISSLVG